MTEVLKVGDSGSQVQALQAELHVRGFYAASIDGHFGPKTKAALEAFQVKTGLEATGTLDKSSFVALGLHRPDKPSPILLSGVPDVGIWLDVWPAAGEEDACAQELAALGLSSASICLWPQTGRGGYWSVGYSPKRLHRLTEALRDAGLDVGWCVWGDGRKVKEQMEALGPCFDFGDGGYPHESRPSWLELDAEEPWVAHAGEHEAEAWVDGAQDLAGDVRVNFVLPLAKPAPQSVRYLLRDHRVSEATLQAYTAFILGKRWTHADAFRPAGDYLRRCCEVTRQDLGGHDRLTARMGLAIYGQSHPDPHPKGVEALRASWKMTRDLGAWASVGLGTVARGVGVLQSNQNENRDVARLTTDEELRIITQRRSELINKKFSETINKKERLELKLIEWKIDRIEDAKYGHHFDNIETVANLVKQAGRYRLWSSKHLNAASRGWIKEITGRAG